MRFSINLKIFATDGREEVDHPSPDLFVFDGMEPSVALPLIEHTVRAAGFIQIKGR